MSLVFTLCSALVSTNHSHIDAPVLSYDEADNNMPLKMKSATLSYIIIQLRCI